MYSNSVVHFKYCVGCTVCIFNGSFNEIWFSVTVLICILCNSVYAFVGEIKCNQSFTICISNILFSIQKSNHNSNVMLYNLNDSTQYHVLCTQYTVQRSTQYTVHNTTE